MSIWLRYAFAEFVDMKGRNTFKLIHQQNKKEIDDIEQ